MLPRGLLCLLVVIATTAVSGCRARDATREPHGETTAATTASPVAGDWVWYVRTRTLDLTGDGRADTVRLQAVGTKPDSLKIVLTMMVGGEVKNRIAWESSYELALADSAMRASDRVNDFLRARLDSVVASVAVASVGAPGGRLMAEDRAALATLAARPSQVISFAYGYETVVRMVWDAPRARFVALWSCC